jgi:hypothetical protein
MRRNNHRKAQRRKKECRKHLNFLELLRLNDGLPVGMA